jgi:hypothetical protein
MSLVDDQFSELKAKYPAAELRQLPNGSYLVVIPDFPIPQDKWSAAATEVKFLIPVGFPQAKPDTFWATTGLRLRSGALPHASNEPNQIPDTNETGLWFSWHTATWNPNRDSLRTYAKVVSDRFNHGT